jgi:hypothetical protein
VDFEIVSTVLFQMKRLWFGNDIKTLFSFFILLFIRKKNLKCYIFEMNSVLLLGLAHMLLILILELWGNSIEMTTSSMYCQCLFSLTLYIYF